MYRKGLSTYTFVDNALFRLELYMSFPYFLFDKEQEKGEEEKEEEPVKEASSNFQTVLFISTMGSSVVLL